MKKTIFKCGVNGMLWGSFACLLFSILLSLRLNTGEFCYLCLRWRMIMGME